MNLSEFLEEWHSDSPYVRVQTSGSTGAPKQLMVEKRCMLNSARMTCDFLGLKPGNTALLCMSVDYIAGKMMVVRAQERGLRLLTVEPGGHPLRCPLRAEEGGGVVSPDFAAMVPLQVYNSLQVPEERERLRQIRHLIIGGGAVDTALAAELAGFPHAVWSTYGMTETLSHIALRRLNGAAATEWYTPLPGVRVSVNTEGCLVIDAPAVCAETLLTNDMAELNGTRFRILGRRDNVICSGGIKIQAEAVERELSRHIPWAFLITKRPDPQFGEAVVLLTEGSVAEAETVCRQVLPKYWQPRAYLHVDSLPMTPTGKPARHQAELLARGELV